jgi:pimeloyl-ACP methyl ester carboxylesterase
MLRAWLLALTLTPGAVAPLAAQAPAIKFEPTTVDVDGVGKVTAELGRLSVLEDRSKPQGRRIELVFARLKSTAAKPGAPVVYLDGGPGGSGIGIARVPEYYRLFDAIRATGDVILLSQRGTGFSSPRLTCRGDGAPVPLDLFTSADRMAQVLGPRSVACAAELRAKGIDLSAYNTLASADDLEDLRLALGVPKISLFGFSYGTHLGLAAARRHPGSIERLILAGTEGPDDSQKYPHTFDLQLARLEALEARSPNAPKPGLVEVTRALIEKLRGQPIQVEIKLPGQETTSPLTLGAEGLQYLLRRDIGDTNDTANIITLIRDASRGDYAMLARYAGRRFGEFGSGAALMGTAMDCASGTSSERMAAINREIPSSLLGRMTNFPFPDICEVLKLPALPDDYRAPIVSTLPALFISGALDSNTPPYQAEKVRWGFPNSTHVIVENAGHESTLPLPEVQALIVEFLKGGDVSGRRVIGKVPNVP